MSPREPVYWFTHPTPLGKTLLACAGDALAAVQLRGGDSTGFLAGLECLGFDPRPGKTAIGDEAAERLDEYFSTGKADFRIPLRFFGTEFQIRVWKTLAQTSPGETLSYGALAELAGRPGAGRAVGNAMAKNRIPLFVPCHRVVASSGRMGGFTGGVDIKRYLLNLESRGGGGFPAQENARTAANA